MPIEIFYYRGHKGTCPVQELFDRLGGADLACCLSQIDLLEGEDLPLEVDHEVDDTPLRVLTVRTARTRFRFIYMRHGEQTIIIDANQGKKGRQPHPDYEPIQDALAAIDSGAVLSGDRIKSHREYVAEKTLGSTRLAAAYSTSREQAQFALSFLRLRSAAGFTTESLAERTGLSKSRIAKFERGRAGKIASLRRIVDALQARVIIAPGTGVSIEAIPEPKRGGRGRKSAES